MEAKRTSAPLYLHITLLPLGLVAATAVVLRWFQDMVPGLWEFAVLVAIAALLILLMARRISAPLTRLAHEAEAVRRFDFTDHPVIRSSVREIEELAAGFDLMRDAIRRFLRINRRLATETDFDALRPWLLDKLVDIAGARGGLLYLADASGEELRAAALDVEGGKAKPAPDLPPLDPHAMPEAMARARAYLQRVSSRLTPDELTVLGVDARFADASALVVPLLDRRESLLGMLVLFKDGEVDATSASFIEALAASAATALETQELLRAQKAMVDATIRMVADAIDAKSPYTGGHCTRVPELTFMLARAACDKTEGPFAGYGLDEEQ